jgi:hypothetical protein
MGKWEQRHRDIAMGHVSYKHPAASTSVRKLLTARHALRGHMTPTVYSGATLQVLRTGTHTNGTHWQITAKCTGCTAFGGKVLTPTGSNRLAFAYAKAKPSNPSSSSSSFSVHDVTNYWSHDFAAAANTNFAALVTKNS